MSSEINGIDMAGFQKTAKVSSKTHVTQESAKQNISAAEVQGSILEKIEFEMENAEHAFALMTEIRRKIEDAYSSLPKNTEE